MSASNRQRGMGKLAALKVFWRHCMAVAFRMQPFKFFFKLKSQLEKKCQVRFLPLIHVMLGVVEPHPDLDGIALPDPVEDVLHGDQGNVVGAESYSKKTLQMKNFARNEEQRRLQRLSSFILFHPLTSRCTWLSPARELTTK